MNDTIKFGCGCSFKTNNNDIVFEPKNINYNCEATWSMIGSGNTKGCFQLESRLGQSMAKKLKPSSIEQLSALISIMRPGCLEAIREGKTVSNHFIDKKNGLESIDYFHPALETSLKSTYGEMIYQEQAMDIATNIAGFDLKEADMLRKAIGKKKPEEMAKIKKIFIEGCNAKAIVDTKEAEQIFGWIEKSQRYSFNKSHAVSYAINAFLSAYTKAHFTKIFFTAYLKYSKDKIDPQQEIKELVRNLIEMDIDIKVPDLKKMNQEFILDGDVIYFGLTNIKGLGLSVYNKIIELVQHNKEIIFDNIYTVLFHLLNNINSTAAKAIISVGGLDSYKIYRKTCLYYLDIIGKLTKKEISFIINNTDLSKAKSLKEILSFLLANHKLVPKRKEVITNLIQSIDKPAYSIKDSLEWIAETESYYLGISISCNKTDSYDISDFNIVDCKQYKTLRAKKTVAIIGEISSYNIVKTKTGKSKGKEMCFVDLFDGTGSIGSVIFFPEQFAKYKILIEEGAVIVIVGQKMIGDKEGFFVDKAFRPTS